MKFRSQVLRVLPVVTLVCSLLSAPVQAQFTQQGPKLVGTGAVGNAQQGISVSLSDDGNTAIVGGFFDDGSAGAAWVYTRSGEVWSQQGPKLVGTGAVGHAFQGTSVSLSGDGNTAIVGGYGDNNLAGAAWVFTRSGGVWSQQGSKLVGTGAVGGPRIEQGWAVSLSATGIPPSWVGHMTTSSASATARAPRGCSRARAGCGANKVPSWLAQGP
jgi:hypothetical protein